MHVERAVRRRAYLAGAALAAVSVSGFLALPAFAATSSHPPAVSIVETIDKKPHTGTPTAPVTSATSSPAPSTSATSTPPTKTATPTSTPTTAKPTPAPTHTAATVTTHVAATTTAPYSQYVPPLPTYTAPIEAVATASGPGPSFTLGTGSIASAPPTTSSSPAVVTTTVSKSSGGGSNSLLKLLIVVVGLAVLLGAGGIAGLVFTRDGRHRGLRA